MQKLERRYHMNSVFAMSLFLDVFLFSSLCIFFFSHKPRTTRGKRTNFIANYMLLVFLFFLEFGVSITLFRRNTPGEMSQRNATCCY